MLEVFAVALRPLAELLATVATPGAGGLTVAAATAAAVSLAALALLAVAVALRAEPARAVIATAHPRRAIDDFTRLTQSHPDAPGHSRPRAPGLAALAA
ncbi:hypothetical protein MRBLMI12_002526 [Microbacterium sp. LMI12-1-1.1]